MLTTCCPSCKTPLQIPPAFPGKSISCGKGGSPYVYEIPPVRNNEISNREPTERFRSPDEVAQVLGNIHQYIHDGLDRLTSDAVMTLSTGVDGSVRGFQYAYDSQGNLYLVASSNAASGGSIVNQVQHVNNGLGQLTGEYQSHSGAVNTSSTPEAQYAYTEMSGGQNLEPFYEWSSAASSWNMRAGTVAKDPVAATAAKVTSEETIYDEPEKAIFGEPTQAQEERLSVHIQQYIKPFCEWSSAASSSNMRAGTVAKEPVAATAAKVTSEETIYDEPEKAIVEEPAQTQEERLRVLIGQLSHADKRVQMEARHALVAIGSEAGPALIDGLKSKEVSTRRFTAWILGEHKIISAVPALLKAVEDIDAAVRVNAARALGEIGLSDSAMAATLMKALGSDGDFLRTTVAETLAEMGPSDPIGMEALVKVLEDGDDSKRTIAAWALGVKAARSLAKNGSPELAVITALVNKLNDDKSIVRLSCLDALTRIGAPAVPSLITWATRKDNKSRANELAERAIDQIDAAAYPELLAIVANTRKPITERQKAMSLLPRDSHFAVAAAIRVLIERTNDEEIVSLREEAKNTLKARGGEVFLALILKMIQDGTFAELSKHIALMSPEDHIKALFADLPEDPRGRLDAVAGFLTAIRGQVAEMASGYFQPAIIALLKEADKLDYDGKAAICRYINSFLSDSHLVFLNCETNLPARLAAHQSRPSSETSSILLQDTRPAEDGRRHQLRIQFAYEAHADRQRSARVPRVFIDDMRLISTDKEPERCPDLQRSHGCGR